MSSHRRPSGSPGVIAERRAADHVRRAADHARVEPRDLKKGAIKAEENRKPSKQLAIELEDKALRETALQHSIDDAEGLLSNLMLSSALMLAFSVTLTTGTFSHDDLLEMDTRNAIIRDSSNNHESEAVLSGLFLEWGMVAVLCFSTALFVGMLEYTSLCYSNCREDEEFFKKWFRFNRWIILGAYLAMTIGLMYFFATNHLAIEMVYPRYAAHGSDSSSSHGLWRLFDSDTKTILEMTAESQSVKDIKEDFEEYGLGYIHAKSKRFLWALGILFPFIITSIIVIHVLVGVGRSPPAPKQWQQRVTTKVTVDVTETKVAETNQSDVMKLLSFLRQQQEALSQQQEALTEQLKLVEAMVSEKQPRTVETTGKQAEEGA